MKLRLNMVNVKMNYKGTNTEDKKCPICKESEDTTEHMFVCKSSWRTTNHGLQECNSIEIWKELLDVVNVNMDIRNQLSLSSLRGDDNSIADVNNAIW